MYNVATNCTGTGVIVEIGSWKGKSTIWLAKESKAGNNMEIYTMGPHTDSSWYRNRDGEVWYLVKN